MATIGEWGRDLGKNDFIMLEGVFFVVVVHHYVANFKRLKFQTHSRQPFQCSLDVKHLI